MYRAFNKTLPVNINNIFTVCELAVVDLDVVCRCFHEGLRPMVSQGVLSDGSSANAHRSVSVHVGGQFMHHFLFLMLCFLIYPNAIRLYFE